MAAWAYSYCPGRLGKPVTDGGVGRSGDCPDLSRLVGVSSGGGARSASRRRAYWPPSRQSLGTSTQRAKSEDGELPLQRSRLSAFAGRPPTPLLTHGPGMVTRPPACRTRAVLKRHSCCRRRSGDLWWPTPGPALRSVNASGQEGGRVAMCRFVGMPAFCADTRGSAGRRTHRDAGSRTLSA